MWLLYTPRAELYEFTAPEAVPGGFAILSHVWSKSPNDPKEQSFKELQALREQCALTRRNPRDYAHPKIRRFCECAERWGHQWVWADMCCIDKSSSSELSEAINSMYRYYSLAEVCYAYLSDVPSQEWLDEPHSKGTNPAYVQYSKFGQSEWHKRGWTLQELIAPKTVIFLSQDWLALGAKADLAQVLSLCTGIPEGLLTSTQRPMHFSIAQRMSWAAHRTTTRLEDEAYCLMGIFDVHMPTLYGEGRRAFRRLQEEIMRKSADPSLFAWGLRYPLAQVEEDSAVSTCSWDDSFTAYLFSAWPKDFAYSREVSFERPQSFNSDKWTRLGVNIDIEIQKVPTFTTTPFGVLASILTLCINGELCAILLWGNKDTDPLVLQLKQCTSAHDAPGDVYHPVKRQRLRPLDVTDARIDVAWRSLYLSSHSNSEQYHTGPILPQVSLASPFHVSPIHLCDDIKWEWTNVTISELRHPWGGNPPLTISFWSGDLKPYLHFAVHLGCCSIEADSDGIFMARWAYVDSGDDQDPPIAHDCPGDHIDQWTNRTRVFRGVYRFFEWGGFWDDVELSFSESPLPIPSGRRKPLRPQLKIISVNPSRLAEEHAANSSVISIVTPTLFSGGQAILAGDPIWAETTPMCPPVHPLVTRHRGTPRPPSVSTHPSSRRRKRDELEDNNSEPEQDADFLRDRSPSVRANPSLTIAAAAITQVPEYDAEHNSTRVSLQPSDSGYGLTARSGSAAMSGSKQAQTKALRPRTSSPLISNATTAPAPSSTTGKQMRLEEEDGSSPERGCPVATVVALTTR